MKTIDHLSVGVPNVKDGAAFYDGFFETLGAKPLAQSEGFAAYGVSAPEFLIMTPYDKAQATAGNGVHIAFKAADAAAVDAAHRYTLKNGGKCEGEPGPRDGYPNPDVYTAYMRDPFGNKLEVIFNGFGA